MKQKTDDEWLGYYAQWQASKKTQRVYCQSQNISYGTFKEKIYQIKRARLVAGVKSKEVVANKQGLPVFQAVNLKLTKVPTKSLGVPYCEIRFGGQHAITISSQESLIALKEMIKCLIQA